LVLLESYVARIDGSQNPAGVALASLEADEFTACLIEEDADAL
jgi:hypothetical protein